MIIVDAYCSMIHGGLALNFNTGSTPVASHCCLRENKIPIDISSDYWRYKKFQPLRQLNAQDIWDPGCANCEQLERSGIKSFRIGSNRGLGIYGQTDLPGPSRIDLAFDISCNLACRTCGTYSSTFWQRHLKEHGEWPTPVFTPRYKESVIQSLEKLDLSNLRQVIFSGGETLLGQDYWDVLEWLVERVPDAKNQLIVGFHTNGTQPINPRNLHIIESFKEMKLHVSIDGVGKRFEYLRWPAEWGQVVDNIFYLRDYLPPNVTFLVEETISIFNLYYASELENWLAENFNRRSNGVPIEHSKHLANGIFSLDSCSQELVDTVSSGPMATLIPAEWKEDPARIQEMIKKIKKFDGYRGESFEKTFPELHRFYAKFW